MQYSDERLNELVNARNSEVPDVFSIQCDGIELYVHVSPYVWIRPWEGRDHTAFSVGLAPGCPNACRLFGKIDVPYLHISLEALKQAAVKRVSEAGISFLTKRGAGVKSFAIHPRGGLTSVDESRAYHDAYVNGYRYVVHVYQLRSGGLGKRFAEWFFFGEPEPSVILTKLRRQQDNLADSMHFEICQLSTELPKSA
ncbi:hypothetical protein R1T43_08875 [Alteromonas sp. CI.11.F.A3]|uniref:hypothetical protein n=1 Tax=unclassified Alteromonas TaxID=2614992 RepID=UPI001B3A35D6|nr:MULTISPECIES: hypothetical protein [unclassified Alteromonas]MBQ4830537.1 hypothetical protein [Alteromonas sp. MMG017]WOI39119.1 hypothetical protein R1T43_08875 [Alteromonas sp. CI.11.F.A3]